MKNAILLLIVLIQFSFPSICFGEATSLDDLLKMVKSEQAFRNKVNREREVQFKSKKEKQAQLLKEAKLELGALEKESERLNSTFKSNEKELTELEAELNLAAGTFGEMFGVVRQVSGDLKPIGPKSHTPQVHLVVHAP